MKKLALGVLATLLLVIGGCGKAGIVHMDIYTQGRDLVRLSHELDKGGTVVPRGYDHPAKWTPEQLTTVLSGIEYQEYSFFAWRKAKRVFIDAEIVKLAPALAKAFAQATPDQWTDFTITARKRDYLWPTPRITNGMFFVQNGKLNLVLLNLNFEVVDEDQRATGDPRKRFAIETYRLVEGPNRSRPPVVAKDPFLRREHANWLILDVPAILASAPPAPAAPAAPATPATPATPTPAATTPAPAPAAAPAEAATPAPSAAQPAETPVDRSVEKRLEELKSLLDKGLITQEEYDRKKQEILQSL
jgi:hypothetical protein